MDYNYKRLLFFMILFIIVLKLSREKLTLEDIKKRIFSVKEIIMNELKEKKLRYEYIPKPEEKMPKEFITDDRLLSPVLNQQNCGSCTAFTFLITTNYLKSKHKDKFQLKK